MSTEADGISEADILKSVSRANLAESISDPKITRQILEREGVEIDQLVGELKTEKDLKKLGFKLARLVFDLMKIPGMAVIIADKVVYVIGSQIAEGPGAMNAYHEQIGYITEGLLDIKRGIEKALKDPAQRYGEAIQREVRQYHETLEDQNRTFLTRKI